MIFQKLKSAPRTLRYAGAIALLFAAADAAAIQCRYTVSNDWYTGFTANITVTNDGASAINGWQVQWQHNGGSTITASWNATVSGSNPYTARNVDWNRTIAPGASQSFGVQANGNNSTASILGCTADGASTSSRSSISSTPVSSTPTSSAPMSSTPMSSTPISSTPASSTPASSRPASSSSSSSGGNTTELTLQENATGFCNLNGTIDSNYTGFTGSGFANTANAAGNGIEWRVRASAGEYHSLTWRYANLSANNRAGRVLVNGVAVATVDFPSTGAWNSWTVASANIALKAGENTIRLEAVSNEGLGNIDSLKVVGSNPQPVACGGSNSSSSSSSSSSTGNGSMGCGSAPGLSSGRHSVTVNGLHREYEINIPSNYNRNNPYRLVFDWHGRGWSARQMAQDWAEAGSLLDRSNGTAVFVAPDRYVSPTGRDDMGWPNTNGRDMDFLRSLLDRINNELCIDQDRIFSAGFSFGGMMSLAVGREMGHVFRAIAPVSGAFLTPHNNRGLPMAIWIAHGKQDGTVAHSNGVAAKDYFVSANSCSNTAVPVNPWPCVEYQGCSTGHPVVWCSYDGGHSGPSFWEAETWNFFSRF